MVGTKQWNRKQIPALIQARALGQEQGPATVATVFPPNTLR